MVLTELDLSDSTVTKDKTLLKFNQIQMNLQSSFNSQAGVASGHGISDADGSPVTADHR
jgi:hypothetical protein